MARKLNPRELRFVENICQGMKKAEAAAAAGYSAHTAGSYASQLLSRDKILQAIRERAERQLNAGVAVGARILVQLAEHAKSEDVRLRAAQALLDRGGMPLVRRSEHTVKVEDRRTEAELVAHVQRLSSELGIAPMLDGGAVEVIDAPALPAPEPGPKRPTLEEIFGD